MHRDHTKEVEDYLYNERLTNAAPRLLEVCKTLMYVINHYTIVLGNDTAKSSLHKAQRFATNVVNSIEIGG